MRSLHNEIPVIADKTVAASIIDHDTMHLSGIPSSRQQEPGPRLRIYHVLPKGLNVVPRHHHGGLYSEIAHLFAEPRSVLLSINLDSLLGQSNFIETRVISSDRIWTSQAQANINSGKSAELADLAALWGIQD